jgi:hypothetical protein
VNPSAQFNENNCHAGNNLGTDIFFM